jgi:hypothetical protein
MSGTRPSRSVRCAIYTRVSTDAGLEQEFNSLDAQYDASQAYIRSQAQAGWTLKRSRDPTCGSCRPRRSSGAERDSAEKSKINFRAIFRAFDFRISLKAAPVPGSRCPPPNIGEHRKGFDARLGVGQRWTRRRY